MRNTQRWILLVGVVIALCAAAFDFSPVVSGQGKSKKPEAKGARPPQLPALDNFDIRVRQPRAEGGAKSTSSKTDQLTLELPKPRAASQSQLEAAATIAQSMRAAQQRLAARVSGLKVDYNEAAGVPEIVSVTGGGPLSVAQADGPAAHEGTLRGFLTENAALYGLTPGQVAQLVKVSDYTNPAGNLSFVEFQQEVNGLPVFQGYVRGILGADGRLVRTTGLLSPAGPAADLTNVPALSATEAVVAAAASIRINADLGRLGVVEISPDGRTHIISQGPFEENTKLELVYFPLAPGNLVLAYSMVLWQPEVAYYVLVDAKTGALLWRKNITQDQTQPATYNIYNNDSPTPSSPTGCTAPSPCPLPPGITRTDVTVVSENPAADLLGWIPDGAGNAVTTGNNADAGLDIVTPNGIDPTGRATATGRVFSFPYIPDGAADPTGSAAVTDTNYRMGIVTNLFFWTNRYHDQIYNYGFTEAARNFQNDNFGRGGAGADFVRAEAQDSSGTNNANFSTPPDGSPPRMQMYIFTTTPNRDGDLDMEVMIHELTHGTSNRLHGNATGLNSTESVGMGEGWSDFYGRALLSTADENVDGLFPSGGYVTKNYYRGIRRFPYAVKSNVGPNGKPHNPMTFADIDPAQIDLSDGAFPPGFVGAADEVHNIGEVWCTALVEMRANLIRQLGHATGNPRAIQIVTDGMKLDPANPTFIDARNSILAANCAGFSGANELDVWAGFSVRGMGFRAGYRPSLTGERVFENFDGPNLTLGAVTATETSGNGNGQFDPGETVSLSIPLSNTLCATSAANATATLSTGGSANYGTIAPGANGTQAVSVVIPASAACGSSIPVTITVNSTTLGPITYNYDLPVGQRAALTPFENFDGVTAPNLPAGWTTSHTGASLGWVTSTSNPDTPPNSAISANPANAGTGSLTSPAIAVDSALGQLSFRNLYNLEAGFDSMVLAIQIDNGAFQEITTAGGSFVSGGYNSNLGWTGLSAGTTAAPAYITTVVNLPVAASGHNIRLRWTVVGDANTIAPGQAGVSIDTIQLSRTAQACASFGVTTVSISGRVTDASANGLNGIQVTLSGTTTATATTSGNGNYTFNSLVSGGNYTVTPTAPGIESTPPNRVYNNLTTNVTDADFVVIPAAGISGRVTTQNGAAGIDGITVTLSGSQAATTTTAGGGFYSFSPLPRLGNYTVTPSSGSNTFLPPSRTYNSLNSAVTNANFLAIESIGAPTPTPPPAQVGQVIISEFRQSVGATTSSNEYVELYNTTDGPVSVGGYGLAIFNATFGGDVVLGFPANVVIPRRGHLLIANVAAGGYSLSAYATPNLSHANANLMPDNQGFGLINASRNALIDSVGFIGNGGSQPYIEGQGLRPTSGNRPNVEHAYVRKIDLSTTFPIDTDNNAADFQVVSVTGATFNATAANGGPFTSILGAPGPENTASPVERSVFNATQLVDPSAPSSGGENRRRFLACGLDPAAPACPPDPNTSAFGYLSIRRKVTNNTGLSVTRLRYRVVDITTLNSPGYAVGGPQADLRVLSSGTITATINGSPATIEGTTLEQPPAQALGGGLNSSLNVGSIALATPLTNGQSVNVQFMLGVQQTGTFRFIVIVEALP